MSSIPLELSTLVGAKTASRDVVRYKLGIQYNGSRFRGWQTQPQDSPTNPSNSSVQTIVTKALERIVNNKVTLIIAGRTDSGVHAIENIAHVDIVRKPKKDSSPAPQPFSANTLWLALNGALKHHGDILITKVEVVDDSFHARFSAIERSYNYRIIASPTSFGKPFEGDGRWFVRDELDLENMNAACDILKGRHDFATFRSASDQSLTTIRTLTELRVEKNELPIIHGIPAGPYGNKMTPIQYTLTATSPAFMTHQVRKMTSVIVDAGRGKLKPKDVQQILDSKTPSMCPTMAPPHALFLSRITYPEHTIYDSSYAFETSISQSQNSGKSSGNSEDIDISG